MKIDTHQHYWRYVAADFPWISDSMPTLRRDRLPHDVRNAMHAAKIDGVVAVQARCHSAETDFLLQLAQANASILGVVGWADLTSDTALHQLSSWHEHDAFKGLRHIIQDESNVSAYVNAPAVNHVLRTLQQHQLTYDVLVFERQLDDIIAFCARHDRHWLVLDHVGKPAIRDWTTPVAMSVTWRRAMRELASMPHVVCKLSGLVTETRWTNQKRLTTTDTTNIHKSFDVALESFGAPRLMYGSDWPVCTLASDYALVHQLALDWASTRLTASEQTDFWSSNAIRCYKLNTTSQQ